MKCKICDTEFELRKENKYIAKDNNIVLGEIYYDAFDCPFCGCQNIANIRKKCESFIEVDSKEFSTKE